MLLQAGAFLLGIQAANALFRGIGQAAMILRGSRGRPQTTEVMDREEEIQDVASVAAVTVALRQSQHQIKLCGAEVEESKHLQGAGVVPGEDSDSAAVAVASCRICYGGAEKSNALISPCRCRGTQAYIHRNCLRELRKFAARRHCREQIFQCSVCMGKYAIPADFDVRAHDGGMVGFGAEACRSTLSKLLHVGIGLALAAILNLIFEALPPPPDATTGTPQSQSESP